jgi:hypothetical protein
MGCVIAVGVTTGCVIAVGVTMGCVIAVGAIVGSDCVAVEVGEGKGSGTFVKEDTGIGVSVIDELSFHVLDVWRLQAVRNTSKERV